MSNNKITEILKKYQRTSRNSKSRRDYFSLFEKRMLYRTTKTENPQTTMGMVNSVLNKLSAKAS
ncbi:hypothetical protein HY745_12635 [Candidatus Desantisbacteria bacterium]|nr:hypothetical protein [Candidatus Desantisbacteria bacterium]